MKPNARDKLESGIAIILVKIPASEILPKYFNVIGKTPI
jgi:hypothetical protein